MASAGIARAPGSESSFAITFLMILPSSFLGTVTTASPDSSSLTLWRPGTRGLDKRVPGRQLESPLSAGLRRPGPPAQDTASRDLASMRRPLHTSTLIQIVR